MEEVIAIITKKIKEVQNPRAQIRRGEEREITMTLSNNRFFESFQIQHAIKATRLHLL